MMNITFVELLKQQFKINLGVLDPLPQNEHGTDVNLILATVREAVKNMKRWNVQEEAILGLFSFTKFVMWNDIHSNVELLKENEVVNRAVGLLIQAGRIEDNNGMPTIRYDE